MGKRQIFQIAAALVLFAANAAAQTSADNVSAGSFGANTGGGNYSFPAKLGIGVSPSVPFQIAVPGGTQMFNLGTNSSGTNYTYGLIENTGGVMMLGVANSTDGTATIFGGRAYASLVGSFNNTPLQLFTNSTARMTLLNDGKVGIGTNTPTHMLDVAGAADVATFPATPATIVLRDTNAYSTADTGSGIQFSAKYDATNWTPIGAVSAIRESTSSSNYAGALVFGARTNGSGTGSMEKMRIRSTGEVVIGPTSGTGQRLTVNGDVTVTGNIGAKYQDLAEWVPASEDLEAGVVVVLDPNVSNQVMPSHRAYDTAVAGVVSLQPGIILGEGGASKEQIATTGRVRVRVDASVAAIRIGDLLVTSDRPGMAMKSLPIDVGGIAIHRPGTVIGKALEPLASGSGEILVLLSLQ